MPFVDLQSRQMSNRHFELQDSSPIQRLFNARSDLRRFEFPNHAFTLQFEILIEATDSFSFHPLCCVTASLYFVSEINKNVTRADGQREKEVSSAF